MQDTALEKLYETRHFLVEKLVWLNPTYTHYLEYKDNTNAQIIQIDNLIKQHIEKIHNTAYLPPNQWE